MQTTPMNFKNGVTIAVLLLIIFFSVGKISKQVQTLVGSGNNLAQVTTAPTAPTGLTAVPGECGGKVNASWNAVSGATYYELVRWPGGVALRSERTTYTDTAPAVSTRYEYQVRAVNSAGSSALPANSVAVVTSAACVAGPTPTVTLSASSASITSGSSSTLTWSSTNATSCTASGAWSGTQATSGTQAVSPTSTSTYTLSCTGASGSASGSTTVSVSAPTASAPTLSLSASPTSVTSGGSATISWSATNARSCTASGGWSGTNGTSGSQSVTPSTTKTYTLDCTGEGGTVSKSVTVTVTTPTTTTPKFQTGDYVKTTAGVNVRSTAGGSIAGKQSTGVAGTVISGPGQSTKSADPYWNVDFATGTDGWVLENYLTKTATAPAPVPPATPAPTLTLSASPATLTSGSSSTLTWSSTNATGCTATGGWSGAKVTGSSEAVTPSVTTTYTLGCTGAGGSVSKSVTVTVSTPAPSTTYKVGDSVATTTSVNVRDSANGLLLGTKNSGDVGVVLSGGTYAGGYHWWNVDYLNAPDGWTAESFLTTYTPPSTPPTVSISASPSSITKGSSATLTWSSTNATSCTGSGAWSGAQAVSGTKTVSPTVNATYTLACTGTGGTTTQSVTVTVNAVITPPPAPSNGVSLTPTKLLPAYGPLVASSSSTIPELKKLESNFLKYEQKHYTDYTALTGVPSVSYNHYGFLGSRLAYSIKNGLPYGSGVTDPTKDMYARGREVAIDWLVDYSAANNYGVAQWWDTSLEDMEAMVVLENNPTARTHIHMDAARGTGNSTYMKMQASAADPRGITIFLQPMLIAHRLGIPFAHPGNGYSAYFDSTLGSWANAAKRNIYWLDQYNVIQSDGTIISKAHGGAEAFFMNAMLVDQLLGYYAYIERDPVVFNMAQRVVDHWINFLPAGWNTLPYQSKTTSTGSGTSQAPDLANFYVYPSLVMWQETGQQKYYDFAVKNLVSAGTAYISGHKQFNQIYNTDVFAADALINGVSWKPAKPLFPPANQTTLAFVPSTAPAGQSATITNGQSLDLTWSTINATSCTASGAWTGSKGTSGILSITPTVTSTYTLSCSGTYGTTTQSVKVTVK